MFKVKLVIVAMFQKAGNEREKGNAGSTETKTGCTTNGHKAAQC